MEIISTKELAKYLKINEKKIYQLTKESKIPHIKIGGKIAYTKEIIDRWIYENTQRGNHIFIAGSDDFLLKKIIDVFNTHKKSLIFYAPVGSMNGLKALGNGVATLSCVHILDIEKKQYTTSYIERLLPDKHFIVVHLFVREQGLYLPKGNPKNVRDLSDIAAMNLSFANRNTGSGTRLLFDYLLAEKKIDTRAIKGYEIEAESHLHCGLLVMNGMADCAFGIHYVARLLGLSFIPMYHEQFDMVIPEENYHSTPVRNFMESFNQEFLLNTMRDLSGYDLSRTGQILYPEA